MIDRYDHEYDSDPQRLEDTLAMMSGTSEQLRELTIHFSGTIRDYYENEDPDQLDLAQTLLPIGRFATQLFAGKRLYPQANPTIDNDGFPAIEVLTLDLVDCGRTFMADPIRLLERTPTLKVLNLFDSLSTDADVIPSRSWGRRYERKRVYELTKQPTLQIVTMTHINGISHPKGFVIDQLIRILKIAPNVHTLILSGADLELTWAQLEVLKECQGCET